MTSSQLREKIVIAVGDTNPIHFFGMNGVQHEEKVTEQGWAQGESGKKNQATKAVCSLGTQGLFVAGVGKSLKVWKYGAGNKDESYLDGSSPLQICDHKKNVKRMRSLKNILIVTDSNTNSIGMYRITDFDDKPLDDTSPAILKTSGRWGAENICVMSPLNCISTTEGDVFDLEKLTQTSFLFESGLELPCSYRWTEGSYYALSYAAEKNVMFVCCGSGFLNLFDLRVDKRRKVWSRKNPCGSIGVINSFWMKDWETIVGADHHGHVFAFDARGKKHEEHEKEALWKVDESSKFHSQWIVRILGTHESGRGAYMMISASWDARVCFWKVGGRKEGPKLQKEVTGIAEYQDLCWLEDIDKVENAQSVKDLEDRVEYILNNFLVELFDVGKGVLFCVVKIGNYGKWKMFKSIFG